MDIIGSIVMYILFVGSALVMGALTAIIFMNLYRKSKRAAALAGVLTLLWIVYQLITLYRISPALAVTVVVIYVFFWIAAYRKLKTERPVD